MRRSIDVERVRFQGEQAVCDAVGRVGEVVTPGLSGPIVLRFGDTVGALADPDGGDGGTGEREEACAWNRYAARRS